MCSAQVPTLSGKSTRSAGALISSDFSQLQVIFLGIENNDPSLTSSLSATVLSHTAVNIPGQGVYSFVASNDGIDDAILTTKVDLSVMCVGLPAPASYTAITGVARSPLLRWRQELVVNDRATSLSWCVRLMLTRALPRGRYRTK